MGKGGRNWSGCNGRSGLPTKELNLHAQADEIHCSLCHLKFFASRSSIIAIHHRHYIILVYRAGGLALFQGTSPPPVHDPGRIRQPAPRIGRTRRGQGGATIGVCCFLLVGFLGAWCSRTGANTPGRSTCALAHTYTNTTFTWSGTRGRVLISAGIRAKLLP